MSPAKASVTTPVRLAVAVPLDGVVVGLSLDSARSCLRSPLWSTRRLGPWSTPSGSSARPALRTAPEPAPRPAARLTALPPCVSCSGSLDHRGRGGGVRRVEVRRVGHASPSPLTWSRCSPSSPGASPRTYEARGGHEAPKLWKFLVGWRLGHGVFRSGPRLRLRRGCRGRGVSVVAAPLWVAFRDPVVDGFEHRGAPAGVERVLACWVPAPLRSLVEPVEARWWVGLSIAVPLWGGPRLGLAGWRRRDASPFEPVEARCG